MKMLHIVLILMAINLNSFSNEEEFNQYFHEYIQELRNKGDNPSSSLMDYINNEPFEKIVGMKLDALPYIIKKFESDKFGIFYKQILGIAFERITKKSMPSGQKVNERYIYYVKWWKEYKSTTRPAFDEVYVKWQQLPSEEKVKKGKKYDWSEQFGEGKQAKLKAMEEWKKLEDGPEKDKWRSHEPTEFQKILNLGFPALPYAVEKVAQGETDLIEAINYWTDDALATAVQEAGVEAENLTEFVPQWWEENRELWTLPESNME